MRDSFSAYMLARKKRYDEFVEAIGERPHPEDPDGYHKVFIEWLGEEERGEYEITDFGPGWCEKTGLRKFGND